MHETTQHQSCTMAVKRTPEWFGIIERTAERGYKELDQVGILLTHKQVVCEARSPIGPQPVEHRALKERYSTQAQADGQKADSAARA